MGTRSGSIEFHLLINFKTQVRDEHIDLHTARKTLTGLKKARKTMFSARRDMLTAEIDGSLLLFVGDPDRVTLDRGDINLDLKNKLKELIRQVKRATSEKRLDKLEKKWDAVFSPKNDC